VAAFPHFQVTFNVSIDHSDASNAAVLVDSLRMIENVCNQFADPSKSTATEGVHPAITVNFNLGVDYMNGSTGSDGTAIGADASDMLKAQLAEFATGAVTVTQV